MFDCSGSRTDDLAAFEDAQRFRTNDRRVRAACRLRETEQLAKQDS